MTEAPSLMDPLVQSDPYDFYASLHAGAPVFRMPETGYYIVSRYQDVLQVLMDPARFSSTFSQSFFALQGEDGAALYEDILRREGWSHAVTLQRADPPLHRKYRSLVDRLFTPRYVREMVPHIDALCHMLIDRFVDRGECDFLAEFALPLPGMIIARELGLDPDEISTFRRWADALLAPVTRVLDREELVATARTEVEMQHFLADLFETRRQEPRNDLVSILVNTPDENGELLTMEESQNIMHQLISGGFESTTSAISHAMWLLIRHPDQMRRLREEPALLGNFVDEALRHESPTQGLLRRATEEVEIAGTRIPKDAILIVRYGAANRDAERFPCPHQFDITRKNARTHLALGAGVHACVGRVLAVQEVKSAFTAILARMDNIELAAPMPVPTHVDSLLLRSLREMRIRFIGRDQADRFVPEHP